MTDPGRIALDRMEIQDQLFIYARGLDRLDEDMVASVYHEVDGKDDYHGQPLGGREFAKTMCKFLRENFASTSHIISNPVIDVRGDIAYSESRYTAWQRFEREEGQFDFIVSGRYVDRFERRDGKWKIAYRYRLSDWNRVDPVLETRQPPIGRKTLRGQRSREDPFFTVFGGAAGTR